MKAANSARDMLIYLAGIVVLVVLEPSPAAAFLSHARLPARFAIQYGNHDPAVAGQRPDRRCRNAKCVDADRNCFRGEGGGGRWVVPWAPLGSAVEVG